ncbi:hypothetical protein [Candidatus Magnetobacterium casense]|nr:hypothetical protein [Candidatus Magnetobacterium casensis]
MGFRDRLGLDRESIIHIIMAIGVSLCIMLIIMFTQMTPKGQHSADIGRLDQVVATLTPKVADNTLDIQEIRDGYGAISSAVSNTVLNVNLLQPKVAAIEGDIDTIQTTLQGIGSPPEAYLTGNLTAGNLTIHAKASDPGNFTANIHLVFSLPIYAGLNWTTNITYVPVMSYNGTDWGTSQVWWNIGTFALAADTNTPIDITFAGLVNQPSFAYIEIYPTL